MELQKQLIESPEKLEVFIMCPGLSKDMITIAFDKKEGILEIQGTSKESELSKHIDLDIKGKIIISPKYRSEKIDASVENGILKITLYLAKNVNIISIT